MLSYLDFLHFYLISFFCSRVPSRTHITVSHQWAPVGCDGFLELPCFDDLYSSEEYQSGAGRNIPQLGLPNVFLLIKLRLWVWEGRPQRRSAFQCITSKGRTVSMTYTDAGLHLLAGERLPGFSTVQVEL